MLATNPNASVRNGPEAVELAQRAIELSGGGTGNPRHAGRRLCRDWAVCRGHPNGPAGPGSGYRPKNTSLCDTLRSRIKFYQAGDSYS